MPLLVALLLLVAGAQPAHYAAPAGDQAAMPRPGAITVLPGGRLLEPHGRQFATGPGPLGIAVSPRGRYLVTADSGPASFSLTLFEQYEPGRYRVRQVAPPAAGSKEAEQEPWRAVHLGAAFRDEQEAFVSEGDSGQVRLIDLRNGRTRQYFELNWGGARDSFPGNLVFDRPRGLLLVADEANSRVAVFDVASRRMVSSVAVGRLPFAMALAPDGRRLYVTHAGMYDFHPVPGAQASLGRSTGLAFPAFGVPSLEARNGARRDTEAGPVDVPGLGDPDAPESNSLAIIDIEDARQPKVLRYVRTGKPLGRSRFGGSIPLGVAVLDERIYVANTNQDSITVIDARTLEPAGEIEIRVPGLEALRGVMPAGMDPHRGTRWLLVAEAGINAVGVVDTRQMRVIGHIPAAWYPVRVMVHEDDVYVVNALGHGAGATANRMIGFRERTGRTGGAVTLFPVPAVRDLPRLTSRVLETNGFVPLKQTAPRPQYPAEVRHVVLVVKESRSYDEVLGDVGRAGGSTADGAPMLARFGRFGSANAAMGGFSNRFSLRNVDVTPNHHTIAVRWAFSDNFYSDAVTGVLGHHWLAGAPPHPWTLGSAVAAAGGNKGFRLTERSSGRLAFGGSRASPHPHEIPENGTIWHHLHRHGIPFRSFGAGFELAGSEMAEGMEPTGIRLLTNAPMPDVLYANTSRRYPGFNTSIPDQYRVDRFIEEIEELYAKPGRELPRFLFIRLPNDEMAPPRPQDGYRFAASYVADNDYALGRLVQFLSRLPEWKSMVFFVTEDDGGGGVDHVNGNRIPLLAAGPWIRRGYVSHRNTSFPGLQKTIYRLLGVPPLHLLDAAATSLSDLFTGEPDFTPYEVQELPAELFVPTRARPAAAR